MINGLRIYALVTVLCLGFVLPASYSRQQGQARPRRSRLKLYLKHMAASPCISNRTRGRLTRRILALSPEAVVTPCLAVPMG